ncbi:hypothetical protein [Streptomyces sp. JJ36]|nr:hypothetical protein [Streptomyces sp. JJ36]
MSLYTRADPVRDTTDGLGRPGPGRTRTVAGTGGLHGVPDAR